MRKSMYSDVDSKRFKKYVKNVLSYEGSTQQNEMLIRAVELIENLEQKIRRRDHLEKEIKDRIQYFYYKTDGTYNFPNSAEGDILKMVKDFFKEEEYYEYKRVQGPHFEWI